MFHFTPSQVDQQVRVPLFEDARADFAPYYSSGTRTDKSRVTVKEAQQAVSAELAKLDGAIRNFQEGYFDLAGQKRWGYNIHFFYQAMPGILRVAGLPIRAETPSKKDGVLVQALLNVRDWIKALVTQQTFSPDRSALIPYLLVDGERTLIEAVQQDGHLPLLIGAGQPPVLETIDGVVLP